MEYEEYEEAQLEKDEEEDAEVASTSKFLVTEADKILDADKGKKNEVETVSNADTEPYMSDVEVEAEALKNPRVEKAYEELKAAVSEELPTKEQEEEAIKKQETVPLSAKRCKGVVYCDPDTFLDFTLDQMAKEAEEEFVAANIKKLFERKAWNKAIFTKSLVARMGTLHNTLSVYRYLNRDVCTIMYEAMCQVHAGESLIPIEIINMTWPVIYDTDYCDFYHTDCFPLKVKVPSATIKHAMISIKNVTDDLLTAFIRERKHSFFCSGCGHILVQAWNYDLQRSRFHRERVMKVICQIKEKDLSIAGTRRHKYDKMDCYDSSVKNQVVWFEFGQRKKLNI